MKIELPELSHHSSSEILDVFQRILEMKALSGGTPIFRKHTSGHCKAIKEIDNVLQKLTLNLLSNCAHNCDAGRTKIWQYGEGLINCYSSLSQDKSYYVTLEIIHPDETVIDKLITELSPFISKRPFSSSIMILSDSATGLELNSIGKIDNPLIEVNYSTSTLEAYKHVTDCLKTNTPCGRFVLLSGPPGTGKSYLIRAISTEINALFVLIPASLGSSLTGPTILPLLASYKDENTPIVLILEDGDTCVSKEARTTNPGGLSDILNLGDGLFGQLADIRIIVTSNANKMELDPAIIRPGRMCKHIAVDFLTTKEATKAYMNLTNSEPPKDIWTSSKTKITLAEVYRRARDSGWAPDSSLEEEIGQYI